MRVVLRRSAARVRSRLRPGRGVSLGAAGSLLVLLLGATVAAALFAARSADRDRRSMLERRAQAATAAIGQRLAAYGEVLYGIRGLFDSGASISRKAFGDYARSLEVQARFPGIQTVSFADAVDGLTRRSYEAVVRRDARRSGSPYPGGFHITPAGNRLHYVVVSYLEPVRGNEQAFGLDLLSEPKRRLAVEQSEQIGRLVATAPITLVQDRSDQHAFLLVLAVRNVAAPLGDPHGGRLLGVVSVAVRVSDFMAGVLRAEPRDQLAVYDVGPDGTPVTSRPPASDLIFQSTGGPVSALPNHAGVSRTQLSVGGRAWTIYYRARGPLGGGAVEQAPWLVAGAGLLLSLLAAALVQAISTRRARAEGLAAKMTAGLRASQEQLERSNAELVRSEEDLRHHRENLEQLVDERTTALTAVNRELEAFAYSVSHDLRAPLRSIDGFSQVLLEDYGHALDDEGAEHLQRVRAASQRMARLIDDMLALSRVTRRELHHEAVDLSALAREVFSEIAEREDGEREIELVVAPDLTARGDAPLLRQLLVNVLGNAWKFTARHERARVEFGATEVDGVRWYFVRDDGAGFDMQYADKLFGAFQRLHTLADFEGSGVGLATAQRIVHRHGGRMRAEGQVEGGATFYFSLTDQRQGRI